jgi:hypothetical protein
MAEVESNKYTNPKRNKERARAGRFHVPTQFHPDRLFEHKRELKHKQKQD